MHVRPGANAGIELEARSCSSRRRPGRNERLCSAIFVRPARSPQGNEAPRCTESRAAPIADTAVGAAALTFGAVALGQALSCSPNCAENLGPALAIISGVVLLGTATSAIYGFQ
jgi:hypothetical protein